MTIISYNNFRKGIAGAKSDMPLSAVQEPAGLMYSGEAGVRHHVRLEKPDALYNMLNNKTGYSKPALMLTGRERP